MDVEVLQFDVHLGHMCKHLYDDQGIHLETSATKNDWILMIHHLSLSLVGNDNVMTSS